MTDPTTPTTSPDAPAGASGEVRAKRRTFSAAEKLRILREAERCPQGELGVLLRREGIYSSHLTTWRRESRNIASVWRPLNYRRHCRRHGMRHWSEIR